MSNDRRSDDNPIPRVPDAYRPIDIEFLKDPHETLGEMRDESRMHRYSSPFSGAEAYVLTHYEDVHDLLSSRDHLLDIRKLSEGDPRRNEEFPPNLLTTDPPEHYRLRGLVNKAFTPRAIEKLKPRIAEIARTLLDEVDGQNEIDFMETLPTPLPVIVIAEMIGVPPDDRDRFKGVVPHSSRSTRPTSKAWISKSWWASPRRRASESRRCARIPGPLGWGS